MRFLGVDFGQRRLGLALSDASGSLARPWRIVAAGATPRASAGDVAALVAARRAVDDEELSGLEALVVGVPKRLNGEDTDQTQPARDFAQALAALTGLALHLQDERLTSYEADERLAERERDWRKRKAKLDAASAAVILQDILYARARSALAGAGEPTAGC